MGLSFYCHRCLAITLADAFVSLARNSHCTYATTLSCSMGLKPTRQASSTATVGRWSCLPMRLGNTSQKIWRSNFVNLDYRVLRRHRRRLQRRRRHLRRLQRRPQRLPLPTTLLQRRFRGAGRPDERGNAVPTPPFWLPPAPRTARGRSWGGRRPNGRTSCGSRKINP